ncbi:MAG: glycosyltransferase [Bacteroidia bacterium]
MAAKKILVAPLDWGLGHATRCIPLINLLIKKGANVEVGANGPSYDLLKKEFPKLDFHTLPGMDIRYTKDGNFILQIMKQLPNISTSIKKENNYLKKLIHLHKYDAVISDNRYGLHSDSVPCILITHQLMLKAPSYLKFMERMLQKKLKDYIENFNYCWIPDWNGADSLSGDLANKFSLNIKINYLGPLSRFNELNESKEIDIDFDLLAIISGPEPQKSIFKEMIEEQARRKNISTLIIEGKPDNEDINIKNDGLIKKIAHADSSFIKAAVEKSKGIIARSGYSTIMDLVALCKNALLVPTPGQTEQEYLASYLKKKNYFRFANQKSFDVTDAFFETNEYNFPQYSFEALNNAVDELWADLK